MCQSSHRCGARPSGREVQVSRVGCGCTSAFIHAMLRTRRPSVLGVCAVRLFAPCIADMIPVCPSAFATFLCLRGFPGDATELDATVEWLRSLDVVSEGDFVGLSPISSARGASDRPREVISFLDSLRKVPFLACIIAPPRITLVSRCRIRGPVRVLCFWT